MVAESVTELMGFGHELRAMRRPVPLTRGDSTRVSYFFLGQREIEKNGPDQTSFGP